MIDRINENMDYFTHAPLEEHYARTELIRSTLEDAVKLFWLKSYDMIPTFPDGEDEGESEAEDKNESETAGEPKEERFDLRKAIADPRYSDAFNEGTINYMNIIRTKCDDALNGGKPLTMEEAASLLRMLDKCLHSTEYVIPLTFLTSLPYGLKKYKLGDLFEGASYGKLFNIVCETHFRKYKGNTIDLQRLGYPEEGDIWIDFMDNVARGPGLRYLWANRISPDGQTIEEEYVGTDQRVVMKYIDENKIRVCFQRDPFGMDEENICKFVGVFKFCEYRDTERGFVRIFKKFSDRYPLA